MNAGIINTITTETSTVPQPYRFTLNRYLNCRPSYLVKLFRYKKTVLNKPPKTELSNVSYDHVIEIQETTTPSTHSVIPSVKKNSKRARYRYSSRGSTTELSTLRYVYDSIKSLSKEKLEESPIYFLIHIDFNT